jgi:hypothetical protein
MSAAQMQLLTAKLPSKEVAALKKLFLRPGFVEEWDSLDTLAAGFSKVLLAKQNQTPSASFKLFTSYDPEAVLWLGFTTTSSAVKERYDQFLRIWPEAKQRIPNALMQEMRITPELPTYSEIVHKIFLELIDGRLTTPEETRAFLEPYSPPAPPPQITIKRSRAKRGAEPKVKERSFDEDEEEAGPEDEPELDDIGGDEEGIDLGIPKLELEAELGEDVEADEDEEEAETDDDEDEPTPRGGKKGTGSPKGAKATPSLATKPAKESAKQAVPKSTHADKVAPKPESKASVKPVSASPVPAAKPATPAAKAKPQPPPPAKKSSPPVPPAKAGKAVLAPKSSPKSAPAKPAAKPPAKAVTKAKAKSPTKAASKAAPVKKKAAPAAKTTKVAKAPLKKPAPKGAKKR